MLFVSDRMTGASGSIGGTTFSHNRFGLYTRARRVPVNPNTTYQQLTRNAFTEAAAAWRGITAGQRAGWEAYAANTPVTNKLGQTVYLSGEQQFVATRSMAIILDTAAIDDAPVTPGRLSLGTPTIAIDASASTIVIANVDSDDMTLGVFLGDPISAGRTFFKGPYQKRGEDTPAAGTFTLAAASGRNGLAFVAGQIIPYRLAGVYDGVEANRLTTIATGLITVVA